MKICFSIDALSASGARAWRLLDDCQHWRSCSYAEKLQDGDARISRQSDAIFWLNRRLREDKELQLKATKKAGRFDFLMRGIFAHAVLHRMSAAPVPDKKQMIDCVARLQPGTAWLLYLNVSGHFRAIDSGNNAIINNLNIAVRGEIASSEHYVGPLAAANQAMMDKLYHQFLAGWLEHLCTSNMQIFIPDSEKLKAAEHYIDAIQQWQHE